MTALTSQLSGVHVLCVNYRLAPQHPFPAGLDDALAVYRALVTSKGYKPASIGMIGDSAGELLWSTQSAAVLRHSAVHAGICCGCAEFMVAPIAAISLRISPATRQSEQPAILDALG